MTHPFSLDQMGIMLTQQPGAELGNYHAGKKTQIGIFILNCKIPDFNQKYEFVIFNNLYFVYLQNFLRSIFFNRKSDCELTEQLCEPRHHIEEYHWNQLFFYSSVFFRVSAQELKFFLFLCVCVRKNWILIDFYHCHCCTQLRTLNLVLNLYVGLQKIFLLEHFLTRREEHLICL